MLLESDRVTRVRAVGAASLLYLNDDAFNQYFVAPEQLKANMIDLDPTNLLKKIEKY
jgi:hypothetical protein